MSEISNIFRSEIEVLHQSLFDVHRAVYFTARKRIEMALIVLHKMESNQDLRQEIRGYIAQFEAIRDDLENTGRTASAIRTSMIQKTGCSEDHSTANPRVEP